MSAALDRLKQQNAHEQPPQQLGSPATMEVLTSILTAVEAQNARLDRLAEQQKKLAGFVKVMDEETTRRLERITAPASTSSPSSDVSARIASIESRQNEIASTLGEFAQSLNGESLNAASRSLVAEAQKNRAATASAIEGLKAQVTANQKLVSQVGGVIAAKTGRHTYNEWDPILNRRAGHVPAMNPFNWEQNRGCRMDYSLDMCARSLEILGRTVMIDNNPDFPPQKIQELIDRINAAAESVCTAAAK